MMKALERMWRNYEAKKTARLLNTLTDAQLRDIGIRRDQIGWHVENLIRG